MSALVHEATRGHPVIDRRLGVALLSAMALHAGLLAWVAFHRDGQAEPAGSQGPHAVDVRLVSLAASARPTPAVAAAEQPSLAHDEPMPAPHDASATNPASVDSAASPSEQVAHADADEAILKGYVPRRWLTVAPEPVEPIVLPFPAEFQERTRYKVILNLYIEADGRVGRVEFVGMTLPDVLARSARNTFEHARFTPGQVKGRIVKSLIQIEVDFDALGAG